MLPCRYRAIISFSHALRGRLGTLDLPAPRRPLPSRFPPGFASARPPVRPRPGRTATALRLFRDPIHRAAFRDLVVCALIGAALVIVLGVTSGCTAPATSARTASPSSHPARLTLHNLSTCSWQVDFAPTAPEPTLSTAVAPGATVALNLAPGDYTVTQTATSTLPANTAPVRFAITIAPGETYTWPLATLLTAAGGAP